VGQREEKMHYYQHHIGDFIKATSRLTDGQAMAYLRLLWMYYDTEKPLKPDTKKNFGDFCHTLTTLLSNYKKTKI
jgi:uncharacterized protein YdaU (DUF1376 family)